MLTFDFINDIQKVLATTNQPSLHWHYNDFIVHTFIHLIRNPYRPFRFRTNQPTNQLTTSSNSWTGTHTFYHFSTNYTQALSFFTPSFSHSHQQNLSLFSKCNHKAITITYLPLSRKAQINAHVTGGPSISEVRTEEEKLALWYTEPRLPAMAAQLTQVQSQRTDRTNKHSAWNISFSESTSPSHPQQPIHMNIISALPHWIQLHPIWFYLH